MQKINKVFISLIVICLTSFIIPFNISAADDPTYLTMTSGSCYALGAVSSNAKRYYKASTDVRAVAIYRASVSNAQGYYYFVSSGSSSFTVNYYYNNECSSSPTDTYSSNLYSYGVDNIPYTLARSSNSYNTTTDYYGLPVIFNSNYSSNELAYRYTFGDLAVGDEPIITYGDLKIGFETSIAYSGGNQDAWRLNKDTIYFDRYDTLGNDLFGYLVELQAIPYSVEGASQQNIFAQGINDYVFDTVKVGHLGYWSPGQDYIDFTWEYITNRFSPTWWSTYGDNWSLVGWKLSENWYRVGWAYRARLVDEDNNELIPWQWIYNGTSIDGDDVKNIVNNNGLTPELVNSINNINNNNNTTNNNYYNNQVINYYPEDQQADGSWIEQLISSILQTLGDLIGKILDFFSSIFDGLVDLILGLFGDINPADSFFNWFSNLFNGIGEIDLTLPQFNIPNTDLSSFNRLVQETLNIFSFNNFGFVIFIPLLLLIIKAVF